jgi:GNAT superfamily N-acetyltransferase
LVRPILPTDAAQLAEAFRRADPDTLYRRFLSGAPVLTERLLHHLTTVDYVHRLALVATDAETGVGVAVVRYEPESAGVAEVAAVVDPGWRRIGLATALVELLAEAALDRGVHTFTATYLAENRPVASLLHSAGGHERIRTGIAECAVALDRDRLEAAVREFTPPGDRHGRSDHILPERPVGDGSSACPDGNTDPDREPRVDTAALGVEGATSMRAPSCRAATGSRAHSTRRSDDDESSAAPSAEQ